MSGVSLAAAAVCTAGAVGLAGRAPARRLALPGRGGQQRVPAVRSIERAVVQGRRGLLALLAPASVVLVVGPPGAAVPALVAGVAVFVLLRRRTVVASRAALARTGAVADLATALAADLAAGHAPLAALEALAGEQRAGPANPARTWLAECLTAAVSTARLGGDVPACLRRRAALPGADGLRAVAAGWEVAALSGAALAPVLEQVASGLRDQLAGDRAVAAALAGSRATARLLAGLPVLALVMGAGLGVSPAGFLLGTPAGRVCLVLGLALEGAGLLWTDALAATALRPGGR